MKQASQFVFKDYRVDRAQGQIQFFYQFEFAETSSETYVETLILPPLVWDKWDSVPPELLDRVLQMLHLFIGTSYWKMYAPNRLRLEGMRLSPEQADFWNTVYTKGLGEFFYKNQLDFRGLVQFPYDEAYAPQPAIDFPRRERCLVPFGGGKDSLVTVERLKAGQKEFDLYALGQFPLLEDMARSVGSEPIIVKRQLDPHMIEQSMKKEVPYNGHIPISTLYTLVGYLIGLVGDYRYVVLSHEHSANEGNVRYLGQEINHQWSKALEFEKGLQQYLRTYVTGDVIPFSLLRPYHEIEIVRQFVQFPEYFSSFSSCNRNFTLSKTILQPEGKAYWCGVCPKCAFVFALLAAFLPKAQLVDMIGKNLFADPELIPLYRELLGLEKIKPFECVGTPDEIRLALWKACERGEYTPDPIMQLFVNEVKPRMGSVINLEKELFTAHPTDTIPKEFL